MYKREDKAAAKNPFLASIIAINNATNVEVWPENWPAFVLFHELQTQWRAAAMGYTGLDYGVLFHKMDRMRLKADEYDRLEADVRVMELEALSTMNEKKE